MKKLFNLIIGMMFLIMAVMLVKIAIEDGTKGDYAYTVAYLIGTLPLIYAAYHFIDPVVSSTPTYETGEGTDEEINEETSDELAQMSLLNEAEPIQIHEAENTAEEVNEEKPKQNIEQANNNTSNQNNKNNAGYSKIISTAIVIFLIFSLFKYCNNKLDDLITPSNEVYSTSQEWLDNDSMVKASLQVIAIDSIKEVERVEVKLDYSKLDFLALNGGIDAGNLKYKYYYIIKGKYTDQSNQTIHDFAIGVGFKDDAAMKEQYPYTVLYYETK